MSNAPYEPSSGATPPPAAAPAPFESRVGRDPSLPLEIGLVNNMPDAALRSTERQIRGLLERSCGELRFNLRVYMHPGGAAVGDRARAGAQLPATSASCGTPRSTA